MSILHFNLNRPIHLARRDVFFERSVELLNMPLKDRDIHFRLQHTEHIINLLKTAELHAFFAARSPSATNQERDFLRFLKLLLDNVQSIHSMMLHQSHLEAETSFLCQFLGASQEQAALPAMHYQRRAEDIFEGVWHILQLAHTPYRMMQQGMFEQMTEDEKGRYRKATASFRDEVIKNRSVPPFKDPLPVNGVRATA